MPGSRISALTAIAGASTANNDNLVIFDASTDTTKRILRSELAIGLVGDLPYVPSGTISATTIPTAIAELDSETAKLAGAQTFTAQQTLSSGLVIQTATAAAIIAIANAINTTNKVAGKVVYDTTNNRIMIASGAVNNSPWYVADGSTFVTPV
jgi:hypothetical protein